MIVGTGLWPALVMVRFIGLEVPPPGAGLVTVTASVAVEAMLDAGMAAVNCVELTNVVTGADPATLTIEDATKLVPLMVSVKAPPPATLLFGEIVVIVGVGLDSLGVG
jgi:hypothetical protein